MFVYKKLKASDVGITAFEAHKSYTNGTIYLGRYNSSSKDSFSQNNLNNELEYFQLDHLFYRNAPFQLGSLNGGINYINQEKRLYDKALIISLPQNQFGEGIQKGSVTVDSIYKDDSKGNLYKSSDSLLNYPEDKERVLYIGPVKGFKRTDLTRDLKTGALLVKIPANYNDKQIDDSLYTNSLIYKDATIEHFSDINCTALQLSDGKVIVPHSSNFNFNDDDFTITFYYKSANTDVKNIIDKGSTQPIIPYPLSNGSGAPTEFGSQISEENIVSNPFEIKVGSNVSFSRTDIDGITSTYAAGSISANTLYHIACAKKDNALKIYINGTKVGSDGVDSTSICRNKADVTIGRDTTEAKVSQIMIWNKELSATEISNVSESIDGSPYVGNVFYENGMVTFTSPKHNTYAHSSSLFINGITLNATSFTEGVIEEVPVTFTTITASGELLFYNEEVKNNPSTIFGGISQLNAAGLLTTNQSNEFSITQGTTAGSLNTQVTRSQRNKFLQGNHILNPITSSLTFTTSSADKILEVSFGHSGSRGTSSGELGTDLDSYTRVEKNSFNTSVLFSLNENLTVTESINVLFVTNSQEVITETFPASDSTIDQTVFSISDYSNNLSLGTKYVNLLSNDGLYLFTDVPSDFEAYPWWSGSLTNSGSVTITSENEQLPVKFEGFTYNVPAGVVQGATYDDQAPIYTNRPGTIKIDTVPTNGFSYTEQLQLLVSISASAGFPTNVGDSLVTRVRFYANGSEVAEETINGFGPLQTGGSTHTFSYPPTPNSGWEPALNDEIYMTLEFDYTGQSFPTADSSFTVPRFGIFQPSEQSPYIGRLETKTSYSTKTSSIYHISCSDLAPNGVSPAMAAGSIDASFAGSSNNNGLNKDVNGNTVGIRTSLWTRFNNTGNFNLITQSFYPSSSYANAANNDFNFTYQTGDSTPETLYFHLIAGTAGQTASSALSQLESSDGVEGALVPDGASMGISGSFTITEVSSSNILNLNSALSNKFTSSLNLSSSIIFGDTSSFLTNTTSSANITGFINNDGTKVLLDKYYLATSSFNATASLDIGNTISGSSSFHLHKETFGIHFVENLTIRAHANANSTQFDDLFDSSIPNDTSVQIKTFVDNTLKDTRYVSRSLASNGLNISNINAFETPLEIGAASSSNKVRFEYTVVSGSNNDPFALEKGKGFAVSNVAVRRITSSNVLSLHPTDPIGTFHPDATTVQWGLSGEHTKTGSNDIPFTGIGEIIDAAPLEYSQIISNDGNQVTINNSYFVTGSNRVDGTINFEKLGTQIEVFSGGTTHTGNGISTFATGAFQVGPFIIPWSHYEGKEHKLEFNAGSKIQSAGVLSSTQGAGIRVKDNQGNIIIQLFDTSSAGTNLNTLNRFFYAETTGTGSIELFISGVATTEFPEGIVASDVHCKLTGATELNITLRSGSKVSTSSAANAGDELVSKSLFFANSGSDTFDYSGDLVNGTYQLNTTAPTQTITIVSPHTNSPANSGYAEGTVTVDGVGRLVGGQLLLSTPLFITGGITHISGTAPSTILVPDSITANPVNPIPTNEANLSASFIGNTIDYVNPTNGITETHTITAIDTASQTITLNNGQGVFQIGTFAAQNAQEVSVSFVSSSFTGGQVNFKNIHPIFENEYHCTVEEDEFNFTLNPTVRKHRSIGRGDLANFATGSNFKPYVTTIGLYNEDGDLLVVGKTAQPVKTSNETDTTFVVKFDT